MERGWRSGPRLPATVPTEPDPAGCFNCGDRASRHLRLRMFTLTDVATGKPAGRWRLCQPCWEWGAATIRPDPDPLDVTPAA